MDVIINYLLKELEDEKKSRTNQKLETQLNKKIK